MNRLVHGLRDVVRPGERLVWCGPNSLEVLTIIAAARKLRAVAVPLSYRFSAEEMTYVVENSDAVCVLADAEYAPLLADAAGGVPEGAVVDRVRCDRRCARAARGLPAPGTTSSPISPTARAAIEDVSDPGSAMIYTSGTTGKPKGAMRRGNDPALIADDADRAGLLPSRRRAHHHRAAVPLGSARLRDGGGRRSATRWW